MVTLLFNRKNCLVKFTFWIKIEMCKNTNKINKQKYKKKMS